MADIKAGKRRMSLKWPALACLILALVGLAPLFSVLISIAVADAFGCALDEGGVHPCIAYGHDIGEQLNVMFVLGWLQLVTWPAVAVAAVGGLVLAIVAVWRKMRQ